MRYGSRDLVSQLPRGGLMYECTGCGSPMPDDVQHVLYCDECLALDASEAVEFGYEGEEDE